MLRLHHPRESGDLEDNTSEAPPGPIVGSGHLTASRLQPSSLHTPKLTQAEKRRLIYPYYAGFSEAFVTAMLDRVGVTERSHLLDPWNGSGTTTYVASTLGVTSTGYDINPALTVVAAARASTIADLAEAQTAWDRLSVVNSTADASATEQCVNLYRQIIAKDDKAGRRLSCRAEALILCALFDTLRRNYQHARTRNPAWFSSKVDQAPLVSFAAIATEASMSFSSLVDRQNRWAPFIQRAPHLHTRDFLQSPPESALFDTVITSPPYLTRLDYVQATLPELSLIARLHGTDIQQLRMQMMGSPLVGPTAPSADPRWGPTALKLVDQVRAHPSKASNTYYLRFFLKYFAHIGNALNLLYQLIAPGGKGCIVVQTSHYKEIFIDLPRIVAEISTTAGFSLIDQLNFLGSRSIVTINSRADPTADKSTVESAIVLKKPSRI